MMMWVEMDEKPKRVRVRRGSQASSRGHLVIAPPRVLDNISLSLPEGPIHAYDRHCQKGRGTSLHNHEGP